MCLCDDLGNAPYNEIMLGKYILGCYSATFLVDGLYRSYDPFQPLASDQSEGAQLTIFYNNVHDNVSTDKVTSTDSMHLVWNIITRDCYIKVLKQSSKTRKLIVFLSA